MKKTLAILLALGSVVSAEETRWTTKHWSDITQTSGSITIGENEKLVIDKNGEYGDNETVNDSYISNGLLKDDGSLIDSYTQNNANSYDYGMLELADDVEFTINGYRSGVGSLTIGTNATMKITNKFTVTKQPGVSLEANSQIILTAATDDVPKSGTLSLGISTPEELKSVVLSVADKGARGDGLIINNSDNTATLGSETASSVEFHNVFIKVHNNNPDEHLTYIYAGLKNTNVVNDTQGSELLIAGATAGVDDADFIAAVKQVSTGAGKLEGTTYGGNVTMLNQIEQFGMESIFIGKDMKVTAKQASANDSPQGESSTIVMQNYNAKLVHEPLKDGGNAAETHENITPQGLVGYTGATLDANLVIGSGDGEGYVLLAPATAVTSGDSTDEFTYKYGINMAGNDLTIQSGVVLAPSSASFDWIADPNLNDKILLFSDVDTFTLGNTTYDDEYFDALSKGIVAADYFVEGMFGGESFAAVPDLELQPDGYYRGWFIEYRASSEDSSLGHVYLVYQQIPEPTTATLSLLALAGLAARRRRR